MFVDEQNALQCFPTVPPGQISCEAVGPTTIKPAFFINKRNLLFHNITRFEAYRFFTVEQWTYNSINLWNLNFNEKFQDSTKYSRESGMNHLHHHFLLFATIVQFLE